MRTTSDDELVASCLPMVRNVAWKLAMQYPYSFPVEELISEGQLALAECLHRFDNNRGSAFGAFARPRVKGAMLDYIRKQCTWQARRHRLAEGRDAPPWALHFSFDAAYFTAAQIEQSVAKLPRRQRWAVSGLLDGSSTARLAQKHNVSYRTMLRWQRDGLSNLQNALPA